MTLIADSDTETADPVLTARFAAVLDAAVAARPPLATGDRALVSTDPDSPTALTGVGTVVHLTPFGGDPTAVVVDLPDGRIWCGLQHVTRLGR